MGWSAAHAFALQPLNTPTPVTPWNGKEGGWARRALRGWRSTQPLCGPTLVVGSLQSLNPNPPQTAFLISHGPPKAC